MELPLYKSLLLIAFSAISSLSAPILTPASPIIAPECPLTNETCFKTELLVQVQNAPQGCSFGTFLEILKGENRPLDPYAKNFNKNGTTDHGMFQINDIWEKEFKRLGLAFDFKHSIKDNIGAAVWICEHRGIAQWTSMK